MTELVDKEQPTGRELEDVSTFTHLSPLEHVMIGSSIEVAGEKFSPSEILEKSQEFLLTPLGLQEGTHSNSQISEGRGRRYISGWPFVFFQDRKSFGFAYLFWLPEIKEDGQIEPSFIVQAMIDTGEVKAGRGVYLTIKDEKTSREFLEKTEIVSEYKDLFFLEGPFDPSPGIIETPWLRLTFKPQK